MATAKKKSTPKVKTEAVKDQIPLDALERRAYMKKTAKARREKAMKASKTRSKVDPVKEYMKSMEGKKDV